MNRIVATGLFALWIAGMGAGARCAGDACRVQATLRPALAERGERVDYRIRLMVPCPLPGKEPVLKRFTTPDMTGVELAGSGQTQETRDVDGVRTVVYQWSYRLRAAAAGDYPLRGGTFEFEPAAGDARGTVIEIPERVLQVTGFWPRHGKRVLWLGLLLLAGGGVFAALQMSRRRKTGGPAAAPSGEEALRAEAEALFNRRIRMPQRDFFRDLQRLLEPPPGAQPGGQALRALHEEAARYAQQTAYMGLTVAETDIESLRRSIRRHFETQRRRAEEAATDAGEETP